MTRAADTALLPVEGQPMQADTEGRVPRMYALEEVRIRAGHVAALALALALGAALGLFAPVVVGRVGMWLAVVVIAFSLIAREIARVGIASMQEQEATQEK